MRNIKKLFVFSFALMLFTSVSIYATPKTEKTLEEKVYSQILSLPNYGVFDSISFEVDGSTVYLAGKIRNGVNRKAAARRIAKLDGVEKVVNNIELLPPSSFDDRIRRQAVRSIANTGGVYRYLVGVTPSVRIIVHRGHLTLVGNVSRKSDSRLLNIIAQGLPNVFSVTNNLNVEKGS